MNKTHAKQLEKQLVGQSVGDWRIQELINFGKSAVVFKAQAAGDRLAAVKVFDPDIIDKHGAEVQEGRIQREKSLIGKVHPYLVKIFDGGFWEDQKLFYVVMEYLPWKNLAEVLSDVPVGNERKIIAQIASASRFLEGLDICHRDIKPENIAISNDFQTAKLLDLGVIRRQGSKPLTDGTGGKIFIGTLKYSPPEFLLGENDDSPESWRAITFYQLGGVLHDLIMRRSLFADFETPYARLVNAVQHDVPRIESKAVSPSLVDLARFCLLKPANTRIELVTWESFEEEQPVVDDIENIKSAIMHRNLATRTEQSGKRGAVEPRAMDEKLGGYCEALQSACRVICIDDAEVFPPVEIRIVNKVQGTRRFFAQFEPSVAHSIPCFLRIEFVLKWVDATSDVCEVLVGAITSTSEPNSKQAYAECTLSLFKGIYSADTVRRGLTAALYHAVNAAQQSSGPSKKKAHTKGEIVNLEIKFPHKIGGSI